MHDQALGGSIISPLQPAGFLLSEGIYCHKADLTEMFVCCCSNSGDFNATGFLRQMFTHDLKAKWLKHAEMLTVIKLGLANVRYTFSVSMVSYCTKHTYAKQKKQ